MNITKKNNKVYKPITHTHRRKDTIFIPDFKPKLVTYKTTKKTKKENYLFLAHIDYVTAERVAFILSYSANQSLLHMSNSLNVEAGVIDF